MLGHVRQVDALLDRLEDALVAVEDEVPGGLLWVLGLEVHLVRGALDARVGAERATVRLLARVAHAVPAEAVVVGRRVVALRARVRLLAGVHAEVQLQAGRRRGCKEKGGEGKRGR